MRRLAAVFWAWAATRRDDAVSRAAEQLARDHERELLRGIEHLLRDGEAR